MTAVVASASRESADGREDCRWSQTARTIFEPVIGKVALYFENEAMPFKECQKVGSKLDECWGAISSLGYLMLKTDTLLGECFSNPAKTCSIVTHMKNSGEEVALKVVTVDVKLRSSQYKFFRDKLQPEVSISKYFAEIKLINVEKEKLYVSMKKAPRGDLLRLLKFTGPLDECTSKMMTWQILKALEALKACGLSHRNIKEENVLLYSGYVVKLADVRSDGEFEQSATDSSTRFFTCPPHLPPEVVDNPQKDHNATAVDMWGVGTLVYYMLCGKKYHHDAALSRKKGGLPRLTPEGASFLRELLHTDPEKRLQLKDSLKHPWFIDVALPYEHFKIQLASGDGSPGSTVRLAAAYGSDPTFRKWSEKEIKGSTCRDKKKRTCTFVQTELVAVYLSTNPQAVEEASNVDWNTFSLYKSVILDEDPLIPMGAPLELSGEWEEDFFRFLGHLPEPDKLLFKELLVTVAKSSKPTELGRASGVRLTRSSFEDILNPTGIFKRPIVDAIFRSMNISTKNQALRAIGLSSAQTALIMKRGRNAKFKHEIVKDEPKIIFLPYNVDGNHWILIIMKPLAREVTILDPLGQSDFYSHNVMTNINGYFLRLHEKDKKIRRGCSYRCFVPEAHTLQELPNEAGVIISLLARRKLEGKDLNLKETGKKNTAIFTYRLSVALELYKAICNPPDPYKMRDFDEEAELHDFDESLQQGDVKFYECVLCKAMTLSYNSFCLHAATKHPNHPIDVQSCLQMWPSYGEEAHVDVSKTAYVIGCFRVGAASLIKLCSGDFVTNEVVDMLLMIVVKEYNDEHPGSVARAVSSTTSAAIFTGSRPATAINGGSFDTKAKFIFLPYQISKGRWVLVVFEPKENSIRVLDPTGEEEYLGIGGISLTLQAYLSAVNGPSDAYITKKSAHTSDKNVKDSGILIIMFVECILAGANLNAIKLEGSGTSRGKISKKLSQAYLRKEKYLSTDAGGTMTNAVNDAKRPPATSVPAFDPTGILAYFKSLEKTSGTVELGIVNGIPILNSSFQRLYKKNTRIDASIVDSFLHIICNKGHNKAARAVPTPDVLHVLRLAPGKRFEDRLNYPPGYKTGYHSMKKEDISSAMTKAATLLPVMGESGFFSLLIVDTNRGCCHVVTTTGTPENPQTMRNALGSFLKSEQVGEGLPISSICIGPYPNNQSAKDKSGLIMLMVADSYVRNGQLPDSLPESIVSDMRFRVAETIQKAMTPP